MKDPTVIRGVDARERGDPASPSFHYLQIAQTSRGLADRGEAVLHETQGKVTDTQTRNLPPETANRTQGSHLDFNVRLWAYFTGRVSFVELKVR